MFNDLLSSSYTVTITGGDTINLNKGEVEAVSFRVDSPDDARAKSNEMAYILEISGKISKGNELETVKLAQWAQLPPNSKDHVERNVAVELVKGGQIVRQYEFSHAFVVDYNEYIGIEGDGSFRLFIKQNRNINNAKISVTGGISLG
jgi:hypothetical protein